MGFFKWLFSSPPDTFVWKKLDNIPRWIEKANFRNPNKVYFYGKTFLYKVIDKPGRIQGEHIVTVYRKLRRNTR